MKQYVGNCSDVIDWNAVVESIKNSKPAYQGPRHTTQDDLPGIKKLASRGTKQDINLHLKMAQLVGICVYLKLILTEVL